MVQNEKDRINAYADHKKPNRNTKRNKKVVEDNVDEENDNEDNVDNEKQTGSGTGFSHRT